MKSIFVRSFILIAAIFLGTACNQKIKDTAKTNTINETEIVGVGASDLIKYEYESVPGDPLGVKIYKLDNGMKVYMSVNKAEPRIQTNIAVRAGSKHDPADATGLAHYLEHMLFKGNSNLGTVDWEKEKVLLKRISDLYEQHRNESDDAKRKSIYHEIDSVSQEASKFVAANEYDKLISSLGAKGTNAYTWVEQTVYVNDIPSNELERWMKVESSRFEELVLRLFHTELEAVYEEFNIGQDSDIRKRYAAIFAGLFPTHPYGTQKTIGKGEHLKNPSHVKIHEYFNTYYKPNNMGIVVSGDFDPDEMVALAEKYFGHYKKESVPEFKFEPLKPITSPVVKEVYGQESEAVDMAWRFNGAISEDPYMLSMIAGILSNGQAGLMDIDLVQKQKVLSADASMLALEDYSMLWLSGEPREGQNLVEVKKLLIENIEKIKKGDFGDWLMDAVVKSSKLEDTRSAESNRARTGSMTNAFIKGLPWKNYVNRFDKMKQITKQQVVDFANKHLNNNYVLVNKKTGEDQSVYKVDKPTITPIDLDRSRSSDYASDFLKEESPRLAPKFVDFKSEIKHFDLDSGLKIDYIKNKNNDIFSLDYIVEMGKNSDKKLPLAISLLPYLGTSKYNAEALQKEFFKLGLSFDVYSGNERVYVTLEGLDESFEEGVKLFEHILSDVQPDDEALKNVVADIMLNRENNKKDKRYILRNAMTTFAKYGNNSAFTDILTEAELKSIKSSDLVAKIKEMTNFEHNIFYYGSKSSSDVISTLNAHHKVPAQLKPVVAPKDYSELETTKDKVYFVDFPMVQSEIYLVSKGTPNFNKEEHLMAQLYNTYFGRGLSSIVFQEIRESKALAYSAFALYGSPRKKDAAHYMQAYVGTQVDKLKDAIPAMMEIIENMPLSETQFNTAKESILKRIESERINNTQIYWTSKTNERRGIDYDIRKDLYAKMKTVTLEDLKMFHQNHVKGRNYTFLVLGSKESIDMSYLKELGEMKELTLKQIFGY